jgi:hypothetical protein
MFMIEFDLSATVFLFVQFCDVVQVAIIHKPMETKTFLNNFWLPNLNHV